MPTSGIRQSDKSLAGFECQLTEKGHDGTVKHDWFDCLDVCGSAAFSTFYADQAYGIKPSLPKNQMDLIKERDYNLFHGYVTC